jgi:GT2 family glycosyltransferase
MPRSHFGYFNRGVLAQNFSAVTAACLLVRKEVFEQVGGFDEASLAIAFNDVDLCLKIREAGYWNVWTPYAEAYHYESLSRGYEHSPEKFARFEKESATMKTRWQAALLTDPAYNPNLTVQSEDFKFAERTRATRPWMS